MKKIKDFQERSEFWSDKERLSNFHGEWIDEEVWNRLLKGDLFKNKDVLEIGPGIGRQFDVFEPLAKKYAVADISFDVLCMEKYKEAERIRINNWEGNYGRFDIIHFWFVIHHMLKEEMGPFWKFLYRHTAKTGYVIFNVPAYDEIRLKQYKEDGMKTTIYKEGEIEENFTIAGFRDTIGPYRLNGNDIYIIEKK